MSDNPTKPAETKIAREQLAEGVEVTGESIHESKPDPAQGTPEPPKVEEIARKLHAFLDSPAFKDSGKHPEDCLADFLRRYFPPASQTPPLENVLDVIGGLIATYETGDHADNPCGNCVICTAEKILEELATPASTARTDGWVSVEDGLPKTTGVYGIYPPEQIDKDQGLNFSPRYFFANEDRNTYVGNKLAYGWVKDKNHKVTHWRELPAAPGSVPQAEPPK